jgi:hypothetical protein
MTTLEQAAKKHNITLVQARKLKSAIHITWDYIAYDYIECFGGEYEAIKAHGSSAAMITQATVDADRLRDHGDVDWFYNLGWDRLLEIAEDVYTAQGW